MTLLTPEHPDLPMTGSPFLCLTISLVDPRREIGEARGEATSHRADGPARIALPPQPWWRTALDNHRFILLVGFVLVMYGSLAVRAFRREDSLGGLVCLLLAALTTATLFGWLRPAHRARRWSLVGLLLLVAAPFVWLFISG